MSISITFPGAAQAWPEVLNLRPIPFDNPGCLFPNLEFTSLKAGFETYAPASHVPSSDQHSIASNPIHALRLSAQQ